VGILISKFTRGTVDASNSSEEVAGNVSKPTLRFNFPDDGCKKSHKNLLADSKSRIVLSKLFLVTF
jgi:hypothetical protein